MNPKLMYHRFVDWTKHETATFACERLDNVILAVQIPRWWHRKVNGCETSYVCFIENGYALVLYPLTEHLFGDVLRADNVDEVHEIVARSPYEAQVLT